MLLLRDARLVPAPSAVTAYYNEFDPFAAAWLMQLIGAGHIAPGVVDTRDLWDVTPNDLAGFTQVHFCAGIGVWSYALRRAGWSDDRPVWTASFPCQPFSAAGQGRGFADERHLWPAGLHLIEQCDPPVVLGEQVASKDGLAWLDLVRADMEGTGRTFAAADLCAAGVGAPHIRQRSFWMAYANGGNASTERQQRGWQQRQQPDDSGASSGLVNAELPPVERQREYGGTGVRKQDATRLAGGCVDGGLGTTRTDAGMLCGLANDDGIGQLAEAGHRLHDAQHYVEPRGGLSAGQPATGPTNGFWRDADWLYCRDGKWRPVEPGTFPLAHGATNRVGRLRGYGNAIVAPVAQTFIESVMACI